MTYEYNICDRILDYRPPRIAMTLLLVAAGIQYLLPGLGLKFAQYQLSGILVAGLGFGIMMRAWWLFKSRNNAICPTATTSVIIVDDIYSLTRNPMYLGMVLILVGVGLSAGSWPILGAAAAYLLVLNHTFCRYEENKLEDLFGDSYRAYSNRVRRWI